MADDLVLRYLTDLSPASEIGLDDLTHLNKGGVDMSMTIRTLIKALVSNAYPVGRVISLANTSNPNLLFPGTTWTRLTPAGRSIRIANGDSDILQTGGSDEIAITEAQMPNHLHYVNINSSVTSFGSAQTDQNGYHGHSGSVGYSGDHNHQGGWGAPGGNWGGGISGTDNSGWYGFGVTSTNGNHNHGLGIDGGGTHDHGITFPAHAHNVEGNTDASGSGQSFGIVNKYINLAMWRRTA